MANLIGAADEEVKITATTTGTTEAATLRRSEIRRTKVKTEEEGNRRSTGTTMKECLVDTEAVIEDELAEEHKARTKRQPSRSQAMKKEAGHTLKLEGMEPHILGNMRGDSHKKFLKTKGQSRSSKQIGKFGRIYGRRITTSSSQLERLQRIKGDAGDKQS